MSELERLEQAIQNLNRTVMNFPIGAVCLDDFKPTEEKIRNARESLKYLNANLLTLKAKHEAQLTTDSPKETMEEIFKMLQDAETHSILNNKTIALCLHSHAINALISDTNNQEMQRKVYNHLSKLFTLNDAIMSIQESIEAASKKQLQLKIKCQKSLSEYHDFLKEQERLRNERLQEKEPEQAQMKERMEKTLRKINIMKKLLTNFIATSSHLTKEDTFLLEMLQEHREPINLESIIKMIQTSSEEET